MRAAPPATILGALLLGLCGCGATDAPEQTDASTVTSTAQRGPVSLTVTAQPQPVGVGQRLTLSVDVSAADGVRVRMPVLPDELGVFQVRRRHTPPDVPEEERRRFRHDYELDTFASGDQQLPALTVEYVDARGEGETIEGTLTSDPLTVTVGTVLAADEVETDYRDIRPAVKSPVPGGLSRAWLPVAALLVAAAVIAVVLRRRRRREEAGPPAIPPHEWALDQLDRLESERLVEQEAFHSFYFRLSDIVRQYIERRFGLMAPERTTEEFLRETGAGTVLSDDHKELLAGFLRAADLVKFARHVPPASDANGALAAARRFIRETQFATPVLEAAA